MDLDNQFHGKLTGCQTVAGMLNIFEKLFGFVFVELNVEDKAKISPTGKADDITWHEDVIMFSVWDDQSESGEFVGYLYLDMHPRNGKYGHAVSISTYYNPICC